MKPKILCAHCNSELAVGDKFCGTCGKPVEWEGGASAEPAKTSPTASASGSGNRACDTCGTLNKLDADFCITCGTDLRSGLKSTETAPNPSSKQSRKEIKTSKKELKPLSLKGSWKVYAGAIVIVAAVVAYEMYNSGQVVTQSAPAQSQQVMPPQEGMGANMAVLPQIEQMERQLGANPNDLNLTLQLANFLHDNRFYDKAITRYREYLKKNPKDPNAHVDLGICYKELGQLNEAKTEMKKALDIEPKHLFAHFNLGIVCLLSQELEESNNWFRKTVALAPTSEVGKRAQQLLTQHSNPQIAQPK
jgi:cytochrome c-type biogenesis protein CcmH/NrfG